MILSGREIEVSARNTEKSLLGHIRQAVESELGPGEIPIRFAVTGSESNVYKCELGVLQDTNSSYAPLLTPIFEFVPRSLENTSTFNAVMVVPTGIGAQIGGHAGDSTPAARLLASVCDTLITHPNVVNASDINELPSNGLYVEGSVLARLLMGTIGLQKVRANRVMLVIGKHPESNITDFSVNSASAARSTLGIDCPRVIVMDSPLLMRSERSTSGSATGRVEGLERLCKILQDYRAEYDSIALTSVIDLPTEDLVDYFQSVGDGVNPWGGVEALLTHAITMLFGVPAAHSPMLESTEVLEIQLGRVDPRMAAEAVSASFLHCVLKGLYGSPRIVPEKTQFADPSVLTAADVSCIVIPDSCLGLPTLAALEQGIPVIAVKENSSRMKNNLDDLPFGTNKLFYAENYLEAVGIMASLKAGISLSSVRRPLGSTKVSVEKQDRVVVAPETVRTEQEISASSDKSDTGY